MHKKRAEVSNFGPLVYGYFALIPAEAGVQSSR